MDWIRSGADDAGRLSHPAITGLPSLHRGGHTPAGDLTVYPRLSPRFPQPDTENPQSGPMIMAGDCCPIELHRGTNQGVPYDSHS